MQLPIDAILARIKATAPRDPFLAVRQRTDAHRRTHGCGAYTYDKAPSLLALAEALAAARILELGTALGYTSLSLAAGSPRALVHTIEGNREHVLLARQEIQRADCDPRIRVYEGDFLAVLPGLSPSYDLVFFDGFAPDSAVYRHIDRLLAPRGVLVSGNLTLAGGEGYHTQIHDPRQWHTRALDISGETAISMRAT